MTEWMRNARLGWLDMTESGKLVALLLVALLLFWFWKREEWKKYHELFIYTTLITVCCICPVTAALLMVYQTKFYDYQWIWTYVPITVVISLAGTLLWSFLSEKYAGTKHGFRNKLGIMAAMVCLVYLCGSLGNPVWDAKAEAEKQVQTRRVLEVITEKGQRTDIVLWAPQGMMEYARALDGRVRLPYGRNMWDAALNAYSYDIYGETEIAMYTWMTTAEATGLGEACVDWLIQTGVNQLLLPANLSAESLQSWELALGKEAETLEGYYWISLD